MKNLKTKRFDWSQVLRDEARITDVLLTDELTTKLNLSSGSVSKALSRLEKRGLINRVAEGVYLNKLVRDLTCVTTGKPKEYRTPNVAITFRTISKRLFWGFVEKQTRYSKYRIAEPEKALLDWIYLSLQAGLTPSLDEIDFKPVDKQKLIKYADKYPGTVRNVLTRSLAFEHFAA